MRLTYLVGRACGRAGMCHIYGLLGKGSAKSSFTGIICKVLLAGRACLCCRMIPHG